MMKETIVTGAITGMAFGGQGILRHEGMVIFIPFAAPGDIVSCRIIQRKKRFAKGELLEVLSPGPGRKEPLCPYFGQCGGCQLQHLNHQVQLDYKQQCVGDALKRIGHLDLSVKPTVSGPQEWKYRRHVTLSIGSIGSQISVGYFAIDNRSLLNIEECPIFVAREDTIFKQVQQLVESTERGVMENGKVAIFKAKQGRFVLYFRISRLPQDPLFFQKALDSYQNLVGIMVAAREKILSFGETELDWDLEGLSFSFSPRTFIQNHPEQSLNIYRAIREIAQKAGVKRVLDLYCGIGISGLLLAKLGIEVYGVEGNPVAIQLAKENAEKNQLLNVKFIQNDVQSVLKGLLKHKIPDMVIVNPPRVGLSPVVVAALLKHSPQEIIYISCMPTTLARDLSFLCADRYQVESCEPFDMFPQTAHVETVVHLRKRY